ncbi:MAG TPA: SHOCT domain-containing protein [Ilumatobacteraceae bacterium]|nr:SHOCT domain-containing protein [Ilumatobacteraceae bacterium]
MMIAAEWGTGQVLWSMLWFFIFVIWIWMIIVIFSDIIRSQDMGGGAKAIWSIFIIFLPYLGIFAYLIARGGGMAERAAQSAQQANEATQAYIRDAAAVSTDADQLAKLADLHNAGKLDDAEYATAKAKVIS